MMNKDITSALDYHEATKHSEISLMTQRHYLDFNNRPIPFKIYTSELPMYPLPSSFSQPTVDTIASISTIPKKSDTSNEDTTRYNDRRPSRKPDVGDLAEILFFSAGITRAIKYNSVTYYMRAASATGALYPIELYVVCKDLAPDLKAGIYHFSPADFSLTQIRSGDYRHQLAAACAEPPMTLSSPFTIVFTSLAWRNAWKYQARSYRHWFWDSGVIVANFLATAVAMGLATRLNMGFVDDIVNNLLCLESRKEATIAIGNVSEEEPQTSKDLLDGEKETEGKIENKIPKIPVPKIRPLSERETSYPEIWALHEASALYTAAEAREWINGLNYDDDTVVPFKLSIGNTPSEALGVLDRRPISPLNQDNWSSNIPGLGGVILRRGSTRRFANSPVSFSILSTILGSSTRGVPLDFLRNENLSLIDIYLICNNIENLPAGGYFFNRRKNSLELLKLKVSREMSGYLCLGQSLFSQASAVLFLMSDLKKVLEALGNRGYRASQFEAGIIAGKIYLAAYALGIGASGSTFFDDAVTEFFSPHAQTKSTMIAVGIGKPAYKASSGRILPVRLTREELSNAKL
ncbi:MAG TPA: SagB/ThcOx family dehydrogenase [Nitrososphaeraceae archaeon]|nr:SagB/ThcOx family dehydrogenase [Nitrososphaeraceae archaeon]